MSAARVQPSDVLRCQISKRTVLRVGVLAMPMPFAGCASAADESARDDRDPVITRVSGLGHPVPHGADHRTAAASDPWSLEDGCLMIDQGVAFWPAGTSWNNDAQEVVFGGDFEGATNAFVDSVFVTGGGGLRAWRTT
jgi:hypothetical protein